jgi:hypothetical protein
VPEIIIPQKLIEHLYIGELLKLKHLSSRKRFWIFA